MRFYAFWMSRILTAVAPILLVVASGPAAALTKTDSICKNVADLDAGDWLILDIDGTIVTEAQMAGRDVWYYQKVQQVMKDEKISFDDAVAKYKPIERSIKTMSRMQLTEKCIPAMIKDLQKRGVYVFAVTGRTPKLADATIAQLSQYDIHLDSLMPPSLLQHIDWSDFSKNIEYKSGVFFADGANKGDVITRLFQTVAVKPKTVSFFDDWDQPLNQVSLALEVLKVNAHIYKYAPFGDPLTLEQMQIGDLEMNEFTEHHQPSVIMDDAHAAELLKCQLPLTGKINAP
jgi:Protein of unknown function (DUF2608)